MSDDKLNSSNNSNNNSNSTIQQSANEDKVQSVKKLIQNLKQQLENEQELREEESRLLQEERTKSEDLMRQVTKLQDIVQIRNSEIDSLEYRNESLSRKVEELAAQAKEKRGSAGGLFTGLFNGKQKQLMESMQSQILSYEEELSIKSEEAERVHEHLYELKKELNGKIDSLNNTLREQGEARKALEESIRKLTVLDADHRKMIDQLQAAKTDLESDVSSKRNEITSILQLHASEKLSLSTLIQAQKDLLDIRIPSFKRATITYDSLQNTGEEDKKVVAISFKEKEREVFKMFNGQRESLKKQILKLILIFEQKYTYLKANMSCSSNQLSSTTSNKQSKQQQQYQSKLLNTLNSSSGLLQKKEIQDAVNAFKPISERLAGCVGVLFDCLDRLSSLEYQMSAAKQQKQTIQQIELAEESDAQKVLFINSISSLQSTFPAFVQCLKSLFDLLEFEALESKLNQQQKQPNEQVLDVARLTGVTSDFFTSLSACIAYNGKDETTFETLREGYASRPAAYAAVKEFSRKFIDEVCIWFDVIASTCEAENAELEDSERAGNGLTTPAAILNVNSLLITAMNAVRAAVNQVKFGFENFFEDCNFKESFILQEFKSLDLIRVAEEYLLRIAKTIELHLLLTNSTLLKEMSNKVSNQSSQILSLVSSVESQNAEMKSIMAKGQTSIARAARLSHVIEKINDLVVNAAAADSEEEGGGGRNELAKQILEQIESFDLSISGQVAAAGANAEIDSSIVNDERINRLIVGGCDTSAFTNDASALRVRNNTKKLFDSNEEQQQQYAITKEVLIKELTSNLTPIESLLRQPAEANSDQRAGAIFEKSRDKILALLVQNNQLEKRQRDATKKVLDKEAALKKCQNEITEQKLLLEKLHSAEPIKEKATPAVVNNMNLIDLL